MLGLIREYVCSKCGVVEPYTRYKHSNYYWLCPNCDDYVSMRYVKVVELDKEDVKEVMYNSMK
jgi:predicted RNA-binding Zn-ribbon protein involved in translation (DUF1610 family)